MDQNVSFVGPLEEAPQETTRVPEPVQTTELVTTEFPPGKRGLLLLLQAAWKAGEDGRDTMRDILHELELRGEQGARLLERVDQRYHDVAGSIEGFQETFRVAQEAAEEQSWQTCDRLEQVTTDLGGVSDHLEAQTHLALEQMEAQREASSTLVGAVATGLEQVVAGQALVATQLKETAALTGKRFQAERDVTRRATHALAETQRRLVEQLESSRIHAAKELAHLTEVWEDERRGRRRRALVGTTVGAGLLAWGLAFYSTTLLPTTRPGSASAQQDVAPAAKRVRAERKVTALPAGMPRAGGD